MNTIPGHKSNTLRGLAVAAILQLVTWSGLTDQVTSGDVQGIVDNILKLIEFAAMLYAGWARIHQPTPPITEKVAAKMAQMTQTSNGDTLARSPWFVGVLLFIGCIAALTGGCTTTPTEVLQVGCSKQANYQVERCADTIARVYSIYQQRGVEIIGDQAAPEDAKKIIRDADAAATPVVRAMLDQTKHYMEVREQLRHADELAVQLNQARDEAEIARLSGELQAAERELELLVQQAVPLINKLIERVGG